MISKEELLKKYNISEEYFEDSDLSWDELEKIYNDYCKKYSYYEKVLKEFLEEHLSNTAVAGVHSYRTRVKEPEHLIVKIIRKHRENYKKYKNVNSSNYEKYLTDLIGIRTFILFKENWSVFHEYITNRFENDPRYYVKDRIRDWDLDPSHNYIAEKPKIHIREGDRVDIYENKIAPESILSNKVYRSIHYIIKYHGVYVEIQVRTLFEEGWGEVDHAIVYPYYRNNPVLKEYTDMMNRLAGLSDEMSSFFQRLKDLEETYLKECARNHSGINPEDPEELSWLSDSLAGSINSQTNPAAFSDEPAVLLDKQIEAGEEYSHRNQSDEGKAYQNDDQSDEAIVNRKGDQVSERKVCQKDEQGVMGKETKEIYGRSIQISAKRKNSPYGCLMEVLAE